MNATGLDGREWRIGRRWLPRLHGRGPRARLRRARSRSTTDGEGGRWFDILELPFHADSFTAALVLIGIAFLLVAFVLWGIPLVLALVDVVVIVVLLVAGVVGRVMFRRPWTVEARSGEDRIEREVVGWRASGAAKRALAHELAHGLRTDS